MLTFWRGMDLFFQILDDASPKYFQKELTWRIVCINVEQKLVILLALFVNFTLYIIHFDCPQTSRHIRQVTTGPTKKDVKSKNMNWNELEIRNHFAFNRLHLPSTTRKADDEQIFFAKQSLNKYCCWFEWKKVKENFPLKVSHHFTLSIYIVAVIQCESLRRYQQQEVLEQHATTTRKSLTGL